MNKRWTCALLAAAGLLPAACHRPRPPAPPTTQAGSPATGASGEPGGRPERSVAPDFAVDAVRTQEGQAAWYDVPENSLPQRRAWPDEMTAASDGLPMNTYVRVRRLDGGDHPPVIVRITDNGVHRHGTLIDVDRNAARALGMVKAGEAKVRVETLALRNASAEKPVDQKEAPAAAKASEISGTPAASKAAEKAAADAKGTR